MADITITKTLVRPLNGAIIRRKTAGGTVNVGDAVYIHTDGTVKQADADALASSMARGICVGVGVAGATAAATGDPVDIVTHGPVESGATGLTDGAVVYVSTTAGAMDQTLNVTAGDFPFTIGYAESDSIIYVCPQVLIPTVNP